MNGGVIIDNRIKVVCTLETIRYYKGDFGIIVASINTIKHGKPVMDDKKCITVKGVMPKLKEGNYYNLTAEYVNDPKWGGQYNVISMFNTVDFSQGNKQGQKRFLSSIFTPNQVENMYKALDDPFKCLENGNADELIKVRGCGNETAKRWIQRFSDNVYMAKIFSELEEYNLTNNIVSKLLDTYGTPDVVISKVKSNPYILCTEVSGIGWKTADKIALCSGIDKLSHNRIGAYIYYCLEEAGQNGCSWITVDELKNNIKDNIGNEVTDEIISEAVSKSEKYLWHSSDKSQIGLKKYFNIENKIAKELMRLRNAKSTVSFNNWENTVKNVEEQNGWQFTDEQKLGVKTALENNVTVIHGEAGTGKSSSVSAFLKILKDCVSVQCALSGRASSRMTEITGRESYTIHRLLGYAPQNPLNKDGFTFHDDNPLDVDIVIVDEISMIDAFLFYHLIRAIPSGAKLICLGDMGQLESIGCGNIAYDMIHSPEIATVYLSQIHRQAASSAIVIEARKIRQGTQIVNNSYTGTETRGELQDLYLDCYSDKSHTFGKIMKRFTEAMRRDNFDIMETQILVPVKSAGDACTYRINTAIQELYNPKSSSKPEIEITSQGKIVALRKGDKVINTQNTYKTEPPIFNGNLGIIKEVFPSEESLIVSFVGIGDVYIDKKQVSSIELGYAITVHKSQGSQFDYVILGVDFSSYSLLTRELLYTGITRAKKKCDLIVQTGALRTAVSKEGVSKKQTHLQQCLRNLSTNFN